MERRKEAEYLAQFGVAPEADEGEDDALPDGNVPLAVVPAAEEAGSAQSPGGNALPAGTASNAPVAEQEPADDAEGDRANNGS